MDQLLRDIKKLTDIIVGSKPDTTIAGEIESMALEIGHQPLVLNANDPNAFANFIGSFEPTDEQIEQASMEYWKDTCPHIFKEEWAIMGGKEFAVMFKTILAKLKESV